MKFTLQINLENDSAASDPVFEVIRVLQHIAESLAHRGDFEGGTIRDPNGNTIGGYGTHVPDLRQVVEQICDARRGGHKFTAPVADWAKVHGDR